MYIDETILNMSEAEKLNETRLDEAVKASKGRITKKYVQNMIDKIIEKEKFKDLWKIKLTNWLLNDLEWAYKKMGFDKVFYTENEINEHYKQENVKEYYKNYYEEHYEEYYKFDNWEQLLEHEKIFNLINSIETFLVEIEEKYKRKR